MDDVSESYFRENPIDAVEFGPELPVDHARDDDEHVVPGPGDPMAVARRFIAERYMDDACAYLLRHHRGRFHIYASTHWPEIEDRRGRSELYRWLENATFIDAKGIPTPWEPTRYKVANVVEALQAVGHVAENVQPPAWLADDGTLLAGRDVVAMGNGLLDMKARELLPHSPAWFSPNCLGFDYDPNAPEPERWLEFLAELWGDDEGSKETLCEICGYLLGGDTSQQKMFCLVGPKRSGKGTIGRVLTGLLGAHHVAAPTLSGLTTNFGLAPLIGKPLAVISDARLGKRADSVIAVERLLSVSGEDTLTFDRKYRDAWTGRLPTRFLILTNELPRFTDSSGALASRFVLLVLSTSFYGRENPALTSLLLEEAPGIFNWALEGLDRLRERGHFEIPASARDALRHLEDLSSPVGAFVRDMCELGPAFEVPKDELWTAWKAWCEYEGRDRPGTKSVFVRDLRASVPGLVPRRLQRGNQREHIFAGIRLSGLELERPLTTPDRPGADDDSQGSAGVASILAPTSSDEPDPATATLDELRAFYESAS